MMRRLLIAVKSRALIDALTQELSSRYEVHSCSTGADVSELIEDLLPDALVMDLRRPKCNGLSALERCFHSPPVIIACTDYIDNDVVRRASAAGVAVLIQMPCTAHCIVEHLECLTAKTPSPEM